MARVKSRARRLRCSWPRNAIRRSPRLSRRPASERHIRRRSRRARSRGANARAGASRTRCAIMPASRGKETPPSLQGRWHAVFRDLTASKVSEAGLVEARVAAERTTVQKSEFLAKVSHEIRTPLNSIVGFADIIAEERFGPLENERYKEYIKDIRASGTHIISLVNDLLDLSKIRSGRAGIVLHARQSQCRGVAAGVALDADGRGALARAAAPEPRARFARDHRGYAQRQADPAQHPVECREIHRAWGPGHRFHRALRQGEVIFRARDTGIGMSERELAQALEPSQAVRHHLASRRQWARAFAHQGARQADQANLSIVSHANEGTLVEVIFPAHEGDGRLGGRRVGKGLAVPLGRSPQLPKIASRKLFGRGCGAVPERPEETFGMDAGGREAAIREKPGARLVWPASAPAFITSGASAAYSLARFRKPAGRTAPRRRGSSQRAARTGRSRPARVPKGPLARARAASPRAPRA